MTFKLLAVPIVNSVKIGEGLKSFQFFRLSIVQKEMKRGENNKFVHTISYSMWFYDSLQWLSSYIYTKVYAYILTLMLSLSN